MSDQMIDGASDSPRIEPLSRLKQKRLVPMTFSPSDVFEEPLLDGSHGEQADLGCLSRAGGGPLSDDLSELRDCLILEELLWRDAQAGALRLRNNLNID